MTAKTPTPDKMKRPNAATIGHATRFQKGKSGNAEHENKPYSIRNNLRWALAQKLDIEKLDDDIKKLVKGRSKKKNTAARLIAIRAVERAMKKAEVRMLEWLTNNAEGMPVQPISLPSMKLSETNLPTLEEAAAAYAADIKL